MTKANAIEKIKILLGIAKKEFATAELVDGGEINFDVLEVGAEIFDGDGNSLKEGEYTIEGGKTIVVDGGGKIAEIKEPENTDETGNDTVETMEKETPETETVDEPANEPENGNTVDERVGELEKKVDELFEMILKMVEQSNERDEKVNETIQEFKRVKATPSAAPIHFNSATETPQKELSKTDLFLRLKNKNNKQNIDF